ncbi:MAG: CDP-alcohol phosphatidyltransferase family protein [candidate division Zixibacteria bacterium]|nr:CDP-alcohol phosphatidyltransferase family protein [candidate division Zixibacteria bacterium]
MTRPVDTATDRATALDAMFKMPRHRRYFNVSVLWVAYFPSVVRLLLAARVRHEVVTVLSILSGLAAAWLIGATGAYATLLVAAMLVHGRDVLDACDGSLARLTGTGHRLGRFLDTIGDGVVLTALVVAIAMRATGAGAPVGTTIVWAVTAWMSMFMQCSYFNYYQLHYVMRSGRASMSRLDERSVPEDQSAGGLTRAMAWLYLAWFGWQDRLMAWIDDRGRAAIGLGGSALDPRCDRWFEDRRWLSANSPLCIGTHLFALILCLLAAHPAWFFPAVAVGMNLYWAIIVAMRVADFRGNLGSR